jgi:hydrogenase-4 component B
MPVAGRGPTPTYGGNLLPVTDPILLFVAADATILLLLGAVGGWLPRGLAGFATTGLSALGALLCLPPLLSNAPASELDLPIGPPDLSLHLALDPISALFLLIIFLCGTAVVAFWTSGESRISASWVGQRQAGATGEIRCITLCLAGLAILLLAADAVTFAIGSAVASLGMSLPDHAPSPPAGASLPSGAPSPLAVSRADGAIAPGVFLPALFLLLAVCLLTPSEVAPRFDIIRAAWVDSGRATTAMAMAIAATMVLLRRDEPRRRWVLDALAAGAVSPCATYLLLRVVIDLPGAMAQGWWGLVLLLLGGAISVLYPWQAAQHPDLDGSVACLTRRQAGLAIIGLGLTLIARSADLPDAASFALAATLLLAIASGAAGTLACLAAQAIGHEAGSWRMVRLGGLIRSMPIASVSLAASLLALVALPPGVGFAAMWLLFQSILSAPRTGGLLTQLPLALIAATLALSSALAIAASVRMIGIAILSRPRSVRGSAARDVGPGPRQILLTLSGISILLGALPGVALKALVAPAISFVTGTGLGGHAGWATLATYAGSPGYSALPVAALLALALGSVMFIVRRFRQQTRLADVWNDGLPASSDLPFGDPHSQSAGAGFLPALPAIGSTAARSSTADSASPGGLNARLRHLKSLDGISSCNLPAARIGLCAILFAFGALLLVLSLFDGGGPHG